MSEIICASCHCELTEDTGFWFDEDFYCQDCLDDTTCLCDHCGRRIWNDDNAGNSERPLCDDCYEDYYTTCEECGRIIHCDDAEYDDYENSYCCNCYTESPIRDYSYKPSPIFYGDGNRYFGVELEIDVGGKSRSNADKLLYTANYNCENIYIKSDGSLNDGMEIVTHPMSLDYHRKEMPWTKLCERALELDYKSHKTTTCGLHIHVNRTTFGETREIHDERISRVLYFVEHHWEELLKFSRRSEYTMKRWAARYGYKNTPKEILEHAKKSCNGRYSCINLQNWNTVEFRMFRGTLKVNTIIATLELVDLICQYALSFDDEEIAKVSWTEFVEGIDEEFYPELVTYLKERRLYINEPVQAESEDE